nr:hypothetical protein [Deltaproteobacteria bacterium]
MTHKKTDGTFSVFRQYRNDIKYDQVLDSRFHIVTVGNPDADLVWAITLMPVK